MSVESEDSVRSLVAQLGGPNSDNAHHALIEQSPGIIPVLAAAFWREPDSSKRALLVEIIWQYRTPESLEFLARAVVDQDAAVWKSALDGFVAIGGSQASHLLQQEKHRLIGLGPRQAERLAWVEEAINQIVGKPE
jgi:hypothetical protein